MALFRFTPEPSTSPDVGASCLRKTYAGHTCQACVTVCPANAISLSDDAASLDEMACIHCGHCLFVCPTGALQHLQPATRWYKNEALVAPFSALSPSTDELLIWHYEYGIRRVAMNIDEHPGWALAIAALNIWLRKFNEPVWQIVPPETKSVNLSRRHLIHVVDEGIQSGQASADRQKRRQFFHPYSEFELSLTLSRCVACGACARACREQALRFNDGKLEWSSTLCTGCHSCMAVCFHRAIMVQPQIQLSYTQKFTFIRKRCTCCQHPFFTMNAEQQHCHICQRHSHNMREA